MNERDYAAPLRQERRKSIWARITNSVRLSIDWDSAPPLIAGFREQFPDLLHKQPPVDDPPLIPPGPEVLQSGYHIAEAANERHARTDSTQEGNRLDSHGRGPQAATQAGGHHQQSMSRRPRQHSRSQYGTQQHNHKQPTTEQVAVSAQLPSISSHSPLWCADLYRDPRPAPTPASYATLQPSYRQHGASNIIYQRNAQGQLFPVSSSSHLPSREQTIRRQPVQSSLRNQVHEEDNFHTRTNLNNNISTGVNTITDRNPVTSNGGYSHYPIYSPLPENAPHALFQPLSRSSSAARHIYNYDEQRLASPHNPDTHHNRRSPQPAHAELRSNAASPLSLAELQGGLAYDPPDFSKIPLLPAPPFARPSTTSREGSTTSLATLENLNPSSPPLSRLQAHIVGLKQHLSSSLRDARSLKVRATELAKRVKPYSRELWNAHVEWKMKLNARIDVLYFGPLLGCTCSVCAEKRGQHPLITTCVAHDVPGNDWRDVSKPHEHGYGRLAFGELKKDL